MKQYGLWAILLLLFVNGLQAQQKKLPRSGQLIDLTATAGSSQGLIAASYVYNRRLGKQRKWEIGAGARWTSYKGVNSDFTTAPAKLSRSNTTPFIIVFAGQKTENRDTLSVHHPFVNALNASINVGYHFSDRWLAGFNIDLIGFSFGPARSATLTSQATAIPEPRAKPTAFNILLTGDNDYGSLDSEFFLAYGLSDHWSLKAVYSFYFAEYKTTTVHQTAPDGSIVTRFRNKVNSLGLGLAYHF
jgi:hypothetical protein